MAFLVISIFSTTFFTFSGWSAVFLTLSWAAVTLCIFFSLGDDTLIYVPNLIGLLKRKEIVFDRTYVHNKDLDEGLESEDLPKSEDSKEELKNMEDSRYNSEDEIQALEGDEKRAKFDRNVSFTRYHTSYALEEEILEEAKRQSKKLPICLLTCYVLAMIAYIVGILSRQNEIDEVNKHTDSYGACVLNLVFLVYADAR